MARSDADIRDQVREKLASILGESSPEDLIRVLFFLDRRDEAYGDADGTAFCPYWKSLKALLKNDIPFEKYAKRLADDTKTAETNPQFLRVMHDVYDDWMTYSETPLPEGLHQGFDLHRTHDVTVTKNFGLAGLARAFGTIPLETQNRLLAIVPEITTNESVLTSANDYIGLVNKTGGKVAMYKLAIAHLSSKVYETIKRWWKGEISGKRCAKNIVDVVVTTAAGLGGGIGGAALGTVVAGPAGTFLGGILGGIAGANVANLLIDRLTQKLFALPKSEALENAYRYLGVNHDTSNAEINAAFRGLCLKHHPYNGGDKQEFFILQNYMAVIKVARGDI